MVHGFYLLHIATLNFSCRKNRQSLKLFCIIDKETQSVTSRINIVQACLFITVQPLIAKGSYSDKTIFFFELQQETLALQNDECTTRGAVRGIREQSR